MTKSVELLIHLKTEYSEIIKTNSNVKAIIVAGLDSNSELWSVLALNWIDNGFKVDENIYESLLIISKNGRTQSMRHKAFKFAKRWEKSQNAI